MRVLPFSRAAIRRCALIRRHGFLELVSQVGRLHAPAFVLPSRRREVEPGVRLDDVSHRAMAGAEKNAELDLRVRFTAIGGLPKPRDGFRRVA